VKNLLCISFFISALSIVALAQTDTVSPCTKIDVVGPAGIFLPNEQVTFTADLSEEAKALDLEYKWIVSGGTIVKGQGTLSVKALMENAGGGLTLTLKVIGLPQKCVDTASETIACILFHTFEVIDEFSLVTSRIDKARLDNFLTKLQENPSATGYIIESFVKGTSRNLINQKNQKIFGYMKLRAFETDRIILSNTYSDKNLTQLFLVPADAFPPSCDDCITVKQ